MVKKSSYSRYQRLFPEYVRLYLTEELVPYQDDTGFLMIQNLFEEKDIAVIIQALLDAVDSNWPIKWASISDQYCNEEIEHWKKFELVLRVNDSAHMYPVLNFIEEFWAISEYHKHLDIRLSVVRDY
mgnify:CR=1 FL=1